MTVRQEVLKVARDLTARGLVPFSPPQVIDELRRRGTSYQESSIRTHVLDFMCIDAPTKLGTRATWGRRYRLLGRQPSRSAGNE